MPFKKPLTKVVARTAAFDKNIRIALLVASVVILWMLSGLFFSNDTPSEKVKDQSPAALKTVAIQNIQAMPFIETVRLTGTVKANALVHMKAQTNGRVIDITKRRGEKIKTGDTLVILNKGAKEEAVTAAEAALIEAESLYKAAKKLNKQGFRADTSLEGQKAQLDAAKQSLQQAQTDLAFTEVTAPFDGILDDRHLEIGDYARQGDNVITVIDTSSYLIEGFVAQKKRHLVHVGKKATFTLINGETVEGVVEFISNAGDEITKTYRVLVRVDGTHYQMPIHMSGELTIPTTPTLATLIPYSALVLDDTGKLGAMIVTKDDNKVQFHEIDPLADSGDGYYIQNLPQQTQLIIKGQNSVQHGETVTPEIVNNESLRS